MFSRKSASRSHWATLPAAIAVLAAVIFPLPGWRLRPTAERRAVDRQAFADRRFSQRSDRARGNSGRHRPDPAPRQAGLFQMVRQARCRCRCRHDTGCDLSAAFADQDRHQLCRDDAGRSRKDQARRSRQQIHSLFRRHEGRRRAQGSVRQGGARSRAVAPSRHDRGSAAAYFGDHLWLLRHERAGQGRV